MKLKSANLLGVQEKQAEIWVLNLFNLDKMTFIAPELNHAIRADPTDELGEGIPI